MGPKLAASATNGRHSPHPRPLNGRKERHGVIWGGKWYHYGTMHSNLRRSDCREPASQTGFRRRTGKKKLRAPAEFGKAVLKMKSN